MMTRPPGGMRSALARLRFTSASSSAAATRALTALSTCSRLLVIAGPSRRSRSQRRTTAMPRASRRVPASTSPPVTRNRAGHAVGPALRDGRDVEPLPQRDLRDQDEYHDGRAPFQPRELRARPGAADVRSCEASLAQPRAVGDQQRGPSAPVDEAQPKAGAPLPAARGDALYRSGGADPLHAGSPRRDGEPQATARLDGHAAVEGIDDVRRLRQYERPSLQAGAAR